MDFNGVSPSSQYHVTTPTKTGQNEILGNVDFIVF
jgi:hypothetical protein